MRIPEQSTEEPVRIDVDAFEFETDEALLFKIDTEELWVPREVVVEFGDDFVDVDWWWANEKGLD